MYAVMVQLSRQHIYAVFQEYRARGGVQGQTQTDGLSRFFSFWESS